MQAILQNLASHALSEAVPDFFPFYSIFIQEFFFNSVENFGRLLTLRMGYYI